MAPAVLEFRVLGPVEVLRNGEPLPLGARRQRAVLARLLLGRREPVAAERIIDDLWAGEPPPAAVGVLQAHVSTLRRALEPDRPARAPASVLISRSPGYALLAETDAEVFTRLVGQAVAAFSAGAAAEAESLLARALGLWRGDPYADLADEPWLDAEISRLQEIRLVALEHRYRLMVADQRAAAAVPELEALVVQYPLREGLWHSLALALYRTRRQADSLFALRRARDTLAEELGIDPGPALRDLEAAVLSQDRRLLEGMTQTRRDGDVDVLPQTPTGRRPRSQPCARRPQRRDGGDRGDGGRSGGRSPAGGGGHRRAGDRKDLGGRRVG